MAIVEGQKIKMTWNYDNKKYFKKLGYQQLTQSTYFYAKLEDLKPKSKKLIKIICDECGVCSEVTFSSTHTRDGKHFCDKECEDKHYKKLDEFLLNELKRYYNEYNSSPKWSDLYYNNNFPNPELYMLRFKKWNKALTKAGLHKIFQKDMSKEELILEGKLFYEKYNRSPYHYELSYDQHIISEMFNGWNGFLKSCNIPSTQKDRLEWNKEYGIEKIKEFFDKNNKIPSAVDLEKYGIHKAWLAGTFGSVRNALIESGLCSEEDFPSKEERINRAISFIEEFYKNNNRPPTVDEYNHEVKLNGKIIWSRNLVKILEKNFSEICVSVINKDIDYNKLGIGRYCVDKNGEFCRSYKEKMISNLLIDNKSVNFQKEVKYSNIYPKIKEGYIMDWYLSDYNIFVELFGMYQENTKKTDKIGYEYKLKTESKIKLCEDNNIKLISIFKRDKPIDIINKFKEYGVELNMTNDFFNM